MEFFHMTVVPGKFHFASRWSQADTKILHFEKNKDSIYKTSAEYYILKWLFTPFHEILRAVELYLKYKNDRSILFPSKTIIARYS